VFDLDAALGAWRTTFARDRGFSAADLDELEDHLRAAYEVELHLDPGLAPATAFAQARSILGRPEDLSGEFAKVGGKAWRWLLRAGWVMFGVAFLLPVHRFGITLSEFSLKDGLFPGVEALLLALTPGGGPVPVLSALTNLAMATTFWRIGDAGRQRVGALAGLLLASVVLNLWWVVVWADQPSELLAGYWAWTASFGVAGAGLMLRARALPDASPHDLLATR
jgi:hypothetical protein